MRSGILIGIDAGTTVFKAAAFDARTGKVLATAMRRMPVTSPNPGWSETPPAALDRALLSTMRSLRAQLGARWKQVCGIGLAAQGGSTIFADRTTGKPHTSMILWNDGRGLTGSSRVRQMKPEKWWRARLLNDWTPAGLGRLVWMKRNARAFFADRSLIHVGAGEYLFHRMTRTWRQDAGNAIQIGSYNAATGALTDDMLTLVGFSRTRVARLRRGHETEPLATDFACAADLTAGIPVAGPYIDQEAALQSVRGVSRRPLQCSLGTAWVGNFALARRQIGNASIQFVLRSGEAEARNVVLPLLTGNVAWDWALSQFVDTDLRRAISKSASIFSERFLPPPGMVCVPWLLQADPVDPTRTGACMFYGIGAYATAHDFVRAAACGLCFEHLRVFRQVKERGLIDAIVLSGGASKAEHFRTVIATLFAPLPVYVQQNEDTAAARGALVAFGNTMSSSPVTRVPALTGRAAQHVLDSYNDYAAAFDMVYGCHPLAAPYTFPKGRS